MYMKVQETIQELGQIKRKGTSESYRAWAALCVITRVKAWGRTTTKTIKVKTSLCQVPLSFFLI